jgi:2-oxoglutarate ferredoxin oxidoreductase subunit beta
MRNVKEYLRKDIMPLIWCPGCGNGQVAKYLIKAVDELGLDKNKVVVVSGIGCSSRLPGYLDFHTMHTIHGRALAFATGIKFANPELTVFVITGDGDASAIGGNHFIHAARRNIDINMIMINNNIYGMTGGQYSPTTPEKTVARTSPYGLIEKPFDMMELAKGAGATFAARTTTYHFAVGKNYIKKAIQHKGFSLVEFVSQCPTYFGKFTGIPNPNDMINYFKNNSVPLSKAKEMSEDELKGKIITGIFIDNNDRKEYCDAYEEVIAAAKGGDKI